MVQCNPCKHIKKSIAIVEDLPDVREALVTHLQRLPDISLLPPCQDMHSALLLVESRCPDILLVDLCLPKGGDGEIVIRRAMQRWGTRCVSAVLSGYGREEFLIDAIRGGAKGFIDKNQEPQSWLESLHMLMAGRSPLNARLARLMLNAIDACQPENLCNATLQRLRTFLLYIGNGTRFGELHQTPFAMFTSQAA